MTEVIKPKFDFDAARKASEEKRKSKRLEAIILGPSGAGKSSLCGTMPGKILYLYGSGEGHGPEAAATYGGGNLDSMCWDEGRNADEALAFIVALLTDAEYLKKNKYTSVCLDSLSELEALIRNCTKFKTLCLTDKGKHNNFAESTNIVMVFRDILGPLRNLKYSIGAHVAVTCPLDVKEFAENGEMLDTTPQLSTYGVAVPIVQQFPDILPVGPMSKGEEMARRIQMHAGVSKISKDAAGRVKKHHNFQPRITGAKNLARTYPADMGVIAKVKEGGTGE